MYWYKMEFTAGIGHDTNHVKYLPSLQELDNDDQVWELDHWIETFNSRSVRKWSVRKTKYVPAKIRDEMIKQIRNKINFDQSVLEALENFKEKIENDQ
jgi:hypothetical protein